MAKAACSDAEFIELFETQGAEKAARHLNQRASSVFQRRRRLEKKIGRQIATPDTSARNTRVAKAHPKRQQVALQDGTLLVGSDSHYWPGEPSTAHRAFVLFCRKMKPAIVVKGGDEFDGASISRHPPIGWERLPTVEDELEVTKERHAEIEKAAPKAQKYWCLGNHDARFETRLATVAPEYARLNGFHLKDHFPAWTPCWSIWINDDVVLKHRFKGGTHARHNNTMWAGRSIGTGHLHRLGVTPLSDYNGMRFGMEFGTMADPYGPQFQDYTEDNPVNWQSGFMVLSFEDGILLPPEPVYVIKEGVIAFRGELINV